MVRKHNLLLAARQKTKGLKFRELCALAEAFGFELDRMVGSHRIYRHSSDRRAPRLTLQVGKSGDSKPYQVKQLLRLIDEFKLEVKK